MVGRRRQNKSQAENELGGARRRVSPLINALIMVHVMAKTKLNLEEAIVQKKHILLNGAGIGKETFRVFVLMFILLIVSTIKAYHLRTGKKAPAVIRLEEAGAYQLIAPFVIEYMQTLRYLSVFFEPMSQSFTDFGDDLPRLMQNSPEKRIFGVGWLDDMEMASKFIAMAGFDPKKLHYQTYQQFADGVEEKRTRTLTRNAGKSTKSEKGVTKTTKQESGGQTEGSTFIARHRVEAVDHYMDLTTQQGEMRTHTVQEHERQTHADPARFYRLRRLRTDAQAGVEQRRVGCGRRTDPIQRRRSAGGDQSGIPAG